MLKVYSFYDVRVSAYMTPFFARADGEAIRLADQEANRDGSQIAGYPEDYSVYRVGTWDEGTGRLEREQEPVPIVQCRELVRKEG